MKLFKENIDEDRYTIATYELESSVSLKDASWNLAIGQSVGNPNVRNSWESDELFEKHSCIIKGNEDTLSSVKSGTVEIGFPTINTDWEGDGISHLLCQLMGGQMDIDSITKCRLTELKVPRKIKEEFFLKPKYGIEGIRNFTKVHNKPILGGIIKPKTGISPEILLEMVKQLAEGGVNFIKEDEILSNPSFCPLEDRVRIISQYLRAENPNVVYAFCINGDHHSVLKRAELVHQLGGNAVHVNIWSGLGVYNSLRKLDLPLFIHFQKSGDKVITDTQHRFGIDWSVICGLAGLMGVDFIHSGMWGGYASDDEKDLQGVIDVLHKHNVMPALSCGMHPGLVNKVTEKFGINYMANVGGALHGHPSGTLGGSKAMRQAIDNTLGKEYYEAIEKWGKSK
jgi:ribulose-bisphosphate carboxylase large chain